MRETGEEGMREPALPITCQARWVPAPWRSMSTGKLGNAHRSTCRRPLCNPQEAAMQPQAIYHPQPPHLLGGNLAVDLGIDQLRQCGN